MNTRDSAWYEAVREANKKGLQGKRVIHAEVNEPVSATHSYSFTLTVVDPSAEASHD